MQALGEILGGWKTALEIPPRPAPDRQTDRAADLQQLAAVCSARGSPRKAGAEESGGSHAPPPPPPAQGATLRGAGRRGELSRSGQMEPREGIPLSSFVSPQHAWVTPQPQHPPTPVTVPPPPGEPLTKTTGNETPLALRPGLRRLEGGWSPESGDGDRTAGRTPDRNVRELQNFKRERGSDLGTIQA